MKLIESERSCHALGTAAAACKGACKSPLALGLRFALGLGLAGLRADTAASLGYRTLKRGIMT